MQKCYLVLAKSLAERASDCKGNWGDIIMAQKINTCTGKKKNNWGGMSPNWRSRNQAISGWARITFHVAVLAKPSTYYWSLLSWRWRHKSLSIFVFLGYSQHKIESIDFIKELNSKYETPNSPHHTCTSLIITTESKRMRLANAKNFRSEYQAVRQSPYMKDYKSFGY